MKKVKNAIIISEYYPKILPPDSDPAQPVTRLTPHFHDITLENVTATDIVSAGAIAGLPEAPVRNVVLKNVHIQAQHGLAISNADVSGENVSVQAADGSGIIKSAGGNITLH
jgi:hypothetical protein